MIFPSDNNEMNIGILQLSTTEKIVSSNTCWNGNYSLNFRAIMRSIASY